MDHFGWIADKVTLFEESLEQPPYAEHSVALRRALQRAFIEACKAGRIYRRRLEGNAVENENAPGVKRSLRRARGAGATQPVE